MWFSRLLITGQIVGIVLALIVLAFAPPATGKMMLIPLTDAAMRRIVPLALAGGAMLVATGPVRGSLVVTGERRRLATALAATAVLIVAAAPAACGANPKAPA